MGKRSLYEFGQFLLDPAQRILLREGERVHLHPKTFLILQILVEANGAVVSKDDLMAKVWPDVVVEEINLTKNISLLRKALSNATESAEFIETIPKIGYRFLAITQKRVIHKAEPITAEGHEPVDSRLSGVSSRRYPGKFGLFLIAGVTLTVITVLGLALWKWEGTPRVEPPFTQIQIR